MNIDSNQNDKSKNLSAKGDGKKDVYTSYNSLSERGEIKSVSKSMHEYIKGGFAKFTPKKP